MRSFKELGLSEEMLKVLEHKGFEVPTPIQEKTIPVMLAGGKDIVGQAQTGTGKTAAFGLPIVELLRENAGMVQALVLTPTRELAIQVAEEIYSLKGKKKLQIVPIYGGQSIDLQLRSLRKGVDIVVGTPGRILDHLRRRTLKLGHISFLILDEADEMLNMGFLEDVTEIMKSTPAQKRTLLFSATMPPAIMHIAKKYMAEYELLKVAKEQLTVAQTDQIYFEVKAADKFEALCRIVDIEDEFYGLIFCRTKVDTDVIANHLMERGYDASALHGDMSQAQREKVLDKFKKRSINILVATDVAARGIDVRDLTHVINYAIPQDPEAYVHRIGRTGRAGKEGNAITFITPSEYNKLQHIQRAAKTAIRKAKLPGVGEVIAIKKRRVVARLEELIKTDLKPQYLEMSEKILRDRDPRDVVAALLKHSFGEELDQRSYAEIKDTVVDAQGKTRLFVRQGQHDGLTRKKLVKIIKAKCDISGERVRDIQIFDKFSFVTLPFSEAEKVLSYFKKHGGSSKPFIIRAKKEKNR